MYGTTSGFTTYHEARDNDVSAYDTAEITSALLIASSSIDARYRSGFVGCKTGGREQVDEWPRTGAYDIHGDAIETDEIPREVEYATYELALKHLSSPGILSKDFTPSLYDSVSVDGAVSVSYSKSFQSAGDIQTTFGIVDETISPVLVNGSSGLSGDVIRV